MITAKTKPKKVDAPSEPMATKGPSQHNSTTESDSSSKLLNLDPETRNMLQIVVRIKKELLKKVKDYDSSGTNESISFVLRGYVGQCGETSQMFIEKSDFQIAEKILRSCENVLKTRVPQELTAQTGLLYQVNNNLANLSNRTGDVPASIKYLLAALDCTNDPRIQNRDDLPIAETLLNLANANTYLGKFEIGHTYAEQAYQFAAKIGDRLKTMLHGCEKKKSVLGESHPEIKKQEEYYQGLIEQYNGQVNLKIMAKLATGQAFEKMEKYDHAIHEFRIGRQLVENTFGTQHHMYPVLANAMGGARLKTKFQTKEVIHKKKSRSRSPPKEKSTKKQKKTKSSPKVQKKLNRAGSAMKLPPRRNIQKVINQADLVDYHQKGHVQQVRNSHQKGLKDNLYLTNCDTWMNVHCHRPKSGKHMSPIHVIQKSGRIQRKKRSTSFDRSISSFKSSKSQISLRSLKPRKLKAKLSPIKTKKKKNTDLHSESLNINITPKKAVIDSDTLSKSTKDATVNQTVESQLTATPQTIVVQQKSCESQRCINHAGQGSQMNSAYLQQLQMMRQVQEDQFKMMQMVMQSQKSRYQVGFDQCCVQNPFALQQYGYTPYGHPMGYDPRQMQGYYANESQTETGTESEVVSETEESKSENLRSRNSSIKKPQAKKNYTEDTQSDLNDRESASKSSKQKRLEVFNVRQSSESNTVGLITSNRSDRAKQLIVDEQIKRKATFQEFAKPDFGIQRTDATTSPYKSSLKQKETIEELHEQGKHENGKENQKCERCKNREDQNSLNKTKSHISLKSNASNKSFRTTSENKSFRDVPSSFSKNEAATIIQKNFKAYKTSQDFKNGYFGTAKEKKQTLFKATYHCADGSRPVIMCKVISKSGFALSLEFNVKEEKSSSQFKITLDKAIFGNIDMYGLNNKVLTVLSKCPKKGNAQQDIQNVFKTKLAVEILKDDETIDTPREMNGVVVDSDTKGTYERELLSDAKGTQDKLDKDIRRTQMETEIRMIRELMNDDAFVLNQVEVNDHKPRFIASESHSSSESSHDDLELIDQDKDDRIKPITIEKIIVNRRFKSGRERSVSNDSEHSYKVLLQDMEMQEATLWKGDVRNLKDVFFVKLVKNDFLDYTLTAKNDKNNSEKVVKYDHLPFEEHQAKEFFEQNFNLEQKDGIIIKISLNQPQQKKNSFLGDSMANQQNNTSQFRNASLNSSFGRQARVSRKILHTYEIIRHETTYHVEVTKQFTEQYQLYVYVLRVEDVKDKANMPLEIFEDQDLAVISEYIEINLKINREIGAKQISHISLSYTSEFLKSMQHNRDGIGINFTINRNGVNYKVTLNDKVVNGIKLICEKENDPTDFCILRCSQLKVKGDLLEFIKANLLLYLLPDGSIFQLKFAGYTDGEGDEVPAIQVVQSDYWRKLCDENVIQCDTRLIATLMQKVDSKKMIDSQDKIPDILSDSPWYQVTLYHVNRKEKIGNFVLTPSQCQQLFDKETFKKSESIGFSKLKNLDFVSLKMQAAVSKTRFESQEKQWRNILRNVIYVQSLREVQFNSPFDQADKQDQLKVIKRNEKAVLSLSESKVSSFVNHNPWEFDKHMLQLEESNQRALLQFKRESLTLSIDQESQNEDSYRKKHKQVIVTAETESDLSPIHAKEQSSIFKHKIEQNKAKTQIQKKMDALKLQAKLDNEKKNKEEDIKIDENIKVVGGCTQSGGIYYNLKLTFDRVTKQIHLTVKPRQTSGNFLAKSQQLNSAYVQRVTRQKEIVIGEEDDPMKLLKDDIETRLRTLGGKFAKQSKKGELPDAFFNDGLAQEETEEESAFHIKLESGDQSSPKGDQGTSSKDHAKEMVAKKMRAVKYQAKGDASKKLERTITPNEQQNKIARGNVKCDYESNVWVNFTLQLDATSKEFYLTVRNQVHRGEANVIAKHQQLSKAYLKKVIAINSIRTDDEDTPLRLISEDITKRLRAFGADHAKIPQGTLPDTFFTKEILADEQEVEFQEMFSPKRLEATQELNFDTSDQKEEDGPAQDHAKEMVQKKIEALKLKARVDEETKKLLRTLSPENEEYKVKTARGNVKCGSNIWVNFTLGYHSDTKEFILNVRNQAHRGEANAIARRQVLNKSYVKKVIGMTTLLNNDEDGPLSIISDDITNRLRAFGAEHAKSPSGQLPDTFFTKEVIADEQEVQFEEKISPRSAAFSSIQSIP